MGPVADFVAELEAADDLAALHRAFQCAIEKLGLKTFIYLKIEGSRLEAVTPETFGTRFVMGTNYPMAFRDIYRANSYHLQDPILAACRSRMIPLTWDDVAENEAIPGDREVLSLAADFGLQNGFTVPIHTPSGARVVISLSSDAPKPEFAAMVAEHQHALHVMALHFHEHMERKLAEMAVVEAPPVKLSPREIECLQWTADGKTAWEISKILGISENTVNFHIKNSMAKLDVHSKTHAVAKAVSMGIAPF